MIYIDQPAGTGFSFTKDARGYATNQYDVARDLYGALVQFYTLFPELLTNDFFVTGESYGGKFKTKYKKTRNYKYCNISINSAYKTYIFVCFC